MREGNRYSFIVSFNAPDAFVADKVRKEIEGLDWTRPLQLTTGRLNVECDTRPDHEIGVLNMRGHNGPKIQFKPVRIADDWPGAKEARWDGQPKRRPKKGELYLSGAIPTAYKAGTDMSSEYFIAVAIPLGSPR